MFSKKLILISAVVALAVGNVAASTAVEKATRISVKIVHHVRNHHVKQEGNDTLVPEGDVDIDIDVYESGSGSGSWTEEPTEEEGSDEEAPTDEEGSSEEAPTEEGDTEEGDTEEGSSDDTYLEEPEDEGDDEDIGECDGDDATPMSVEGVEGIFCVSGVACAGEIEGACPEAQDGLEYGAYCGIVDMGVYGCKPNDAKHHKKAPARKQPVVKKVVVKKVAAKKVEHKKVEVKKAEHKKAVHKH